MTARTFRAYSDAVNRNRGSSFPLGATVCPGGVNFSVFSKNATAVELLFFDRTNDPTLSEQYISIRKRIKPITTGMFMCLIFRQGRYMVIVSMDLLIPSAECVLTRRRCSLIPMVRLLLFPETYNQASDKRTR